MKTISMIGVAVALCVPALASAQRGGGAGAVRVQRVESVQRVDTGRTIARPATSTSAAATPCASDRLETGTRIRRPAAQSGPPALERRASAGPDPPAR